MKKNIINVLMYLLFIIIPVISVLFCISFKLAQGEKNEEIVFGIMVGLVLDFIYSIILLSVSLFINKKKKSKPIPTMPPWNEIVELMHDKNLDLFCDEIINVIYSKDNTMRYVILKNKKGLLRYKLEVLHQFDEEAWQYLCMDNDVLPAMWESHYDKSGVSLFVNEEELMKDLKSQSEYKIYYI